MSKKLDKAVGPGRKVGIYNVILIEAVEGLGVGFLEEVKWEELEVEDCSWNNMSAHDMEIRFNNLVKTYVPLARALDFSDVLNVLKTNYVEKMKRKLDGEKVKLRKRPAKSKRKTPLQLLRRRLRKERKLKVSSQNKLKINSQNKLILKKKFLKSAETLPSVENLIELD